METTKTYVELLYPGSFFSEEDVIEVKKRDPKAIAKKYPNAFCLQFFDLTSRNAKVDGQTVTISGKRKNVSPKYFPEGKAFTKEQVAAKVPDSDILVSNMQANGWDKVVRTRRGNWQPLEKDCEII